MIALNANSELISSFPSDDLDGRVDLSIRTIITQAWIDDGLHLSIMSDDVLQQRDDEWPMLSITAAKRDIVPWLEENQTFTLYVHADGRQWMMDGELTDTPYGVTCDWQKSPPALPEIVFGVLIKNVRRGE